MECPHCKVLNDDNAQRCRCCYRHLEEACSPGPDDEQKIDKKKLVRNIVIYTVSLCALIILSMISVVASIIAFFILLTMSIHTFFEARKSKVKLRGKAFIVIGVTIPNILFGFKILWHVDAPPIPNDYTIADYRPKPARADESFALLNSLGDEKPGHRAHKIGLTEEDHIIISDIDGMISKSSYIEAAKLIIEHSLEIRALWDKTEKARCVISSLNQLPEIADLTFPTMEKSCFDSFSNLVDLRKVYRLYVLLEVIEQNNTAVVQEMIEFDSVIRKLTVYARSIITKSVFCGILCQDITTANLIVNRPDVPEGLLESIRAHYVPISNDQASFKDPLISEYIIATKYTQKKIFEEMPSHRFMKNVPHIKWNSTFRVYRNYIDSKLVLLGEYDADDVEPLSVWPSFYPDLGPVPSSDPNTFLPWHYKKYNPVGSRILEVFRYGYYVQKMQKQRLLILDDLFQIVLATRMGGDYSLKGRVYSDEYIIDLEKKIIYNPGPDGVAFTDDDIKLEINPEVLRLTE